MTRRLGVLGGTFDPVHFGHLDAAEAARSALALDEVLFVPSHDPPHRTPHPGATAFHRFALLALAVNDRPGYRVSDVEMVRTGRSYTSDTLRGLHAAGWAPSDVFFILGADAWAEIATWHEFPAVLDAAHFVVIARPGTSTADAVAHTPDLRRRVRPVAEQRESGGPPAIFLVEARTRSISSTAIRERLAARQPVGDFVPSAVARHIAANHLYVENTLHGHDQNHQDA